MVKFNPVKYAREVRQETSKVTWPTRKETLITTTMVLIMVVIVALFFLLVDQVLQFLMSLILGYGG